MQTSEPFEIALQWCLSPWLQTWKCPDWTVSIYPCTVYEANSSCQTMLFNLFILKRHMTLFFLWFLYVHTCSWCVLLEFYWEVITAVNNGNSLDTSCIFAQTTDRALEKQWMGVKSHVWFYYYSHNSVHTLSSHNNRIPHAHCLAHNLT